MKVKAVADPHGKEASFGYKSSGRKQQHCQQSTSFLYGAQLRTACGLHQRVRWTCGRMFRAKLASHSILPNADQHKTNEQTLDRSAVLATDGKCDYQHDESISEWLFSSSKSGRRLITQALLPATLVALAAPPPPAEAVQLQVSLFVFEVVFCVHGSFVLMTCSLHVFLAFSCFPPTGGTAGKATFGSRHGDSQTLPCLDVYERKRKAFS